MPPHEGLVHPKEYDVRDSNVELIGSDIDHRVKHRLAAAEPAWNDGAVGREPGLRVWRIKAFEVVPWPRERYGEFYDGNSYIVLHSVKPDDGSSGSADGDGARRLSHDIFFWLGAHTTQDEAGTAAYKTVELDEFLHGAATQHRELQRAPSDAFLALFPRLAVRSGGVRSGFRHVAAPPPRPTTLLRVFTAGGGVVVHEVEPSWRSLDDGDVFVLDAGDKVWVWQGAACSPMEKAKAAHVVHDMTQARGADVEVPAQAEARSRRVVELLGGGGDVPRAGFAHPRPLGAAVSGGLKRLFRLSDASGQLAFDLVRDGGPMSAADLDGNDVFLLDDGCGVWVWEGRGASRTERARWLAVAQAYLGRAQAGPAVPLAKVVEGCESRAFLQALEAH